MDNISLGSATYDPIDADYCLKQISIFYCHEEFSEYDEVFRKLGIDKKLFQTCLPRGEKKGGLMNVERNVA